MTHSFRITNIKKISTYIHPMIASVPITYVMSWASNSIDSTDSRTININNIPEYIYFNNYYPTTNSSPYFSPNYTDYPIYTDYKLLTFIVSGDYDINLTVTDINCPSLFTPPGCNPLKIGCNPYPDPACPTLTSAQPPTITLYVNGRSATTTQGLSLNFSNRFFVGDYISMTIMNNDSDLINYFDGSINIVVKDTLPYSPNTSK